ncbi:hypothetical protein V6N13_025833 [Hibiscus sabdariffa]
MFAVVLWNLWLHRNAMVFGSEVDAWGSILTRSKWLASNSTTVSRGAAPVDPRGSAIGPNVPAWSPPSIGKIRLNSDGACQELNGRAFCGGVFRDHTDVNGVIMIGKFHSNICKE